MNKDVFCGQKVRLTVADKEKFPKLLNEWSQDSEFVRFLDSDPAYIYNTAQTQKFLEEEFEHNPIFMIQTLEGDQPIGFIELSGIHPTNGDAFVGIGIGVKEYWGKGYGTDAMQILLRYSFEELNLHRVSLNVFDYNPRAIKSYLKAGFKIEGRQRNFLHREGQRWDLVFMGILKRDWEQLFKN